MSVPVLMKYLLALEYEMKEYVVYKDYPDLSSVSVFILIEVLRYDDVYEMVSGRHPDGHIQYFPYRYVHPVDSKTAFQLVLRGITEWTHQTANRPGLTLPVF